MSEPASLVERLAPTGGYAADLVVTEGLAPGEVLEGFELEACRFERSVLEGAVLRDCTFTDCVFTGVNLNRVDLSGSRFSDCQFVECTALAVIWTRAAEAAAVGAAVGLRAVPARPRVVPGGCRSPARGSSTARCARPISAGRMSQRVDFGGSAT